ncbi:MAG: hypothetical protein J5930_01030 [Treponema sp.]|nr:hypothetical protein [Treponema sp.]
MKIVTICGSMKFENEMKRIAFQLETRYKMCVLQCVYNEDDKDLSDDEIEFLNSSHFKKIEISDAVYIVNINEYIGEQVKKEMAYAKKSGKEVILHTDFIKNKIT